MIFLQSMRRAFARILVAMLMVASVPMLVAALSAQTARAGEYDLLFQEFDASGMSEPEKRLLQTGLAFEGDYKGLLDGDWGRGSRRALAAYVAPRFPADDPQRPEFFHAFSLIATVVGMIDESGWDDVRFDELGVSIAAPWGLMKRIRGADQIWETGSGDLEIRIIDSTPRMVTEVHEMAESYRGVANAPYLVRRDDRMVTSVEFSDGGFVYVRSDPVASRWVTVMLTVAASQAHLLGPISSGIHFGPARSWVIADDSLLSRVIDLGSRYVTDRSGERPARAGDLSGNNRKSRPSRPIDVAARDEAERKAKRRLGPVSGSGTAFFINNTDLVTAEHVVAGCAIMTLEDGTELTVMATDPAIDLAVLSSPTRSRDWLTLLAGGKALLGEPIFVLGYPYYGLVGTSLSLTSGNVSALTGIGDDRDYIAISAPVQPGNSGGPLLNSRGEILGVISARLSDEAISEATGSLPQNINYAVTGVELINFLDRSGVNYPRTQPNTFDMTAGTPAAAQRAVVPVLCR